MSELKKLRKRVNALLARAALAKGRVRSESAALQEAKARLKVAVQAQDLLQQVAQTVQEEAHARIAGVVSKCLTSVFGDTAYEFRVLFERKRGRTEARLVFVRNGQELNPVEECGLGQVDVAAFALQLACLMLKRPRPRLFLATDEPFRFVSRGYQERVAEMVETLAQDLDMQFVVVTHSPDLAVGKVVDLNCPPQRSGSRNTSA